MDWRLAAEVLLAASFCERTCSAPGPWHRSQETPKVKPVFL